MTFRQRTLRPAAAAAVTIAAPPTRTVTRRAHPQIHRTRIAIHPQPVRASPRPAIRIKPSQLAPQIQTQWPAVFY